MLALLAFRRFGCFALARAAAADLALLTPRAGMAPMRLFSSRDQIPVDRIRAIFVLTNRPPRLAWRRGETGEFV
jgi:hypothetical protein